MVKPKTRFPEIEEELMMDEADLSPYRDYDDILDNDGMSAGEAAFLRGYSESADVG